MPTTIRNLDILFNDSTTQSSGQQAAKAWVNFNGTGTISIRTSFNVSSLTDNGSGDYTINLTNAISSDACVVGSSAGDGTSYQGVIIGTISTTTIQIYNAGASSFPVTKQDNGTICVAAFR
jgi:hypothetical protein